MKKITIQLTEQDGRLLARLLQQIPLSGKASALAPALDLIEDVCFQVETQVETAVTELPDKP